MNFFLMSVLANVSLLLLSVVPHNCDRIPPRYTINLDLAPENRWDEVIDDHKELIPAVTDEIKWAIV